MAFGTKHAVDIPILVLGKAHVVDVCCGIVGLGHGYRLVPKAEIVYAIRAFGHSKKAFAVAPFNTNHQQILVAPLHCARIERGIHHDALHQVGVSAFVHVVTPLQRRMFGSEYRVRVAFVNAVAMR